VQRGNGFLYTILILALAGIALSVLSLNEHSVNVIANQIGADVKSSFCDISSEYNCTAVNQSTWSSWLGIPVASFGLWYFLVLILSVSLFFDREKFYEDEAFDSLAAFSFIGLLVSLALFLISKFKIGVLCPLCLGIYAVNFLFFIAAIFFKPKNKGILVSVRDGIFCWISFVFEGLSLTSRSRASVLKLFALAVLLAAGFSYSLKDYLSLKYLNSFTEEPNWEAEKVRDIKVDLTPGFNQDYSKGPSDAALKIVEFADFECPACQILDLVLSELLQKYEGKVQYVYKNYPLDNSCNPALNEPLHLNGCYSAYLARCAGEQGKFWEMSNYLFKLGSEEADSRTAEDARNIINQGIARLELDQIKIDECLKNDAVKNKITSDIKEGDSLGITGTPSLFINGRIIRDISYENLIKIFTSILEPKA